MFASHCYCLLDLNSKKSAKKKKEIKQYEDEYKINT